MNPSNIVRSLFRVSFLVAFALSSASSCGRDFGSAGYRVWTCTCHPQNSNCTLNSAECATSEINAIYFTGTFCYDDPTCDLYTAVSESVLEELCDCEPHEACDPDTMTPSETLCEVVEPSDGGI